MIKRKLGWVSLVLLGVILLFTHKLVFSNQILGRGDVLLYFYPYWQAAASALRAGTVPLWNPHLFMGVPFLANSQIGFFYPLNWLVWLVLPTPYAVSASIVIHLVIAGMGCYLVARNHWQLSPMAALVSALLFALGGYLTAQAEHINQLQGLAWLPYLIWLVGDGVKMPALLRSLLLALFFALQLLAGHSQSSFITGIGVGLYALSQHPFANFQRLKPLLAAILIAIGLTAGQLLPTLELTSFSSRQGGLSVSEVLSFSWHPLLVGRAILPAYGQSLFTEYVAFLPLSAWLLAVVGMAWSWQQQQKKALPLFLLFFLGGFLALGRFNPLYWLLAELPGFDLFRVPARWLVWFAFSAALFAGIGLERCLYHSPIPRKWWIWGFLGLLVAIFSWFLAPFLGKWLPVGSESPLELPTKLTLLGWATELLLFFIGGYGLRKMPARPSLLALFILLTLFLSSRSQPYNHPTTPEAYFDLRPPVARLQALTNCLVPELPCPLAPLRFLSLSDIFFDPGDQAEIDTIYAGILPADAQFDYTVAIKQKEIIAPNLPLAYQLYAIDGFDGGLLPLATYSQAMQLILPAGTTTTDGRLREWLPAIPEAKWLDLFGVGYLITDKVGDEWQEGVFFDRQHPATITPEMPAEVGYLPNFPATELWLWNAGTPGTVSLTFTNGHTLQAIPTPFTNQLSHIQWTKPLIVQSIQLASPTAQNWQLTALSLVNHLDQTFHPLILGQYRQIYSGDVKIYENLDPLPRAQLFSTWTWHPDNQAALNAMQQPTFDPTQQLVLVGDGQLPAPHPAHKGQAIVTLTHYQAEQIALQTTADYATMLLLTEAFAPGWRAYLDGAETAIFLADGMFRGLFVPAGSHTIHLEYQPLSFTIGVWIAASCWLLWMGGALWAVSRQLRQRKTPTPLPPIKTI